MNAEREKDAPLLSVVVPVYNGEKFVPLCFQNLINQTYKNLEVIFVNDGSKDRSGIFCDQCAAQDGRFRVIHKENGGTARARNAGLEAAKGKYITFLDCDDSMKPDMYEKMVNLMEQSGADVGICGFYYKVEQAESKGKGKTAFLEEKIYPETYYTSQEEIRKDLVKLWDSNILFNVWNKLYRMDLIKEKNLRFRNGHVHSEDVAFNRLFVENCSSMAITEECLYYYIVEREGSTTEKFWDNYFEIRDKDFHYVMEHFKKLGEWNEVSREYTCRYFLERVSGVIENLFHAGKELGGYQKYCRAREIINHKDVIYAGKYAKCRSRKMRVLVYPIRHRITWLACLEHMAVYRVRKANPALFYKMKNRR